MTGSIVTAGQLSGNDDDGKNKLEVQDLKKHSSKFIIWDDILKEVARRKSSGQKANLFSEKELSAKEAKQKANLAKKTDELGFVKFKRLLENQLSVRCSLGPKYNNKYFTRRETECMICLIEGKTFKAIASTLKISIRTVEHYVKNMKKKVGCRTKYELIDLVRASEFVKNVIEIHEIKKTTYSEA